MKYAEKFFDLFFGFLQAIGLITLAGGIGLYYSGFFYWLGSKSPEGSLMRWLFA